jgi:hypothetical protein
MKDCDAKTFAGLGEHSAVLATPLSGSMAIQNESEYCQLAPSESSVALSVAALFPARSVRPTSKKTGPEMLTRSLL